MTAAQFEELETPEVEAVLRWRFEELVRAGYDAGSALILAGHVEVDLHDATASARAGLPARDGDRRSSSEEPASLDRGINIPLRWGIAHLPAVREDSDLHSCGESKEDHGMTAAQFEMLEASEAEELLRARFESLTWHGCPPVTRS